MLVWLRIRDLVLLEDLAVEPGPSLTVITGETGAGKSMLVDALELVVGARGGAGLVRTGAEEAVVEAQFDLSSAPAARQRLTELTGQDDTELVVRRVIRDGGRSRITVNGQLVTASQLGRLVGGLVDICSQHEHHDLADPASHLGYLDAWADLPDLRARMVSAWEAWRAAAAKVDALGDRLRLRADREAVLRFQLDEIDAVDPKAEEEEVLTVEHARLAHADRLATATREAELAIDGADGAIAGRLGGVRHTLEGVRGLDPALDGLADQVAALHESLNDVARDLGRYARRTVGDPVRLREIDERLVSLRRLLRKYGGALERVLAHRDAARAELDGLTGLENELETLELVRQGSADQAVVHARELSARRHAAAQALGAAMTHELRDLGMGDARVEVDVAGLDARAEGLVADGARIGATGMDRAELMISPNLGEPPRPLRRIGSGGELSRALLAIKQVLAARAPRGLLVFDEVDTGVGGGVAEAIGRKLDQVARHHQVICITHLPQIAVYADRHVHIRKNSDAGRTRSTLTLLQGDVRREEIARMMGGIDITDATRGAAQALLDQAAAAKQR